MLILEFRAGSFETNAYVVAAGLGRGCVIIDPGQRSAAALHGLVTRHHLEPEAILLTHGHMDHTWDVLPLSERYGVPVYVHPDDRFMVAAPARGLPESFPRELLAGHPNREPSDVRPCGAPGSPVVEAAGLTIQAHHVAGHTPGSVTYYVESGEPALFTGDALFAGSLGRSDGPGGDAGRLRDGLSRICRPLDDATRLLPGHGGPSTLGGERRLHAFLR
ncbi:MBL fold metallo-hydrolase [Microbispora rosea]|uniref:MBL fold metallo-hydrolase n=1 Tax=Microbispora rosea TaxID=58117 RepID=UPI00343EF3BA